MKKPYAFTSIIGYRHRLDRIINLKRVIEEGDTNLDSDATSEFFSFGVGDENNKNGERNEYSFIDGKL